MADSSNRPERSIATLADAYLAAAYAWRQGAHWRALRVGASAPEAEHAFPGAACFGVVSAWNPASVALADARNAARDDALCARIVAGGWAHARSRACDRQGGWQEPGWLLAGIAVADLVALARDFGQLGVLAWTRGTPVRLCMLHPRPAAWPDAPTVDWLE